ncbi:MAG: RNA-binding domain-containing protein [Nitrosopumilaceae archaeon]|nr:RNA-binding domain-containing protein [Nitrosopumilaceae archaeon]
MVKLDLTIDVIIHATEDVDKFLETFEELLGLKEDDFSISHVAGHFENQITIMHAKITKKPAQQFLEKFLEIIDDSQKNEIIREIEERTENSTLHIRFDKQDFIRKKISFREKDAIRLKIHTPVYNKKETIQVFSDLIHQVN